jgi:hypothetical protein
MALSVVFDRALSANASHRIELSKIRRWFFGSTSAHRESPEGHPEPE